MGLIKIQFNKDLEFCLNNIFSGTEKLLELVIYDQLQKYLNDNILIAHYLDARSLYSCETSQVTIGKWNRETYKNKFLEPEKGIWNS